MKVTKIYEFTPEEKTIIRNLLAENPTSCMGCSKLKNNCIRGNCERYRRFMEFKDLFDKKGLGEIFESYRLMISYGNEFIEAKGKYLAAKDNALGTYNNMYDIIKDDPEFIRLLHEDFKDVLTEKERAPKNELEY